jgi:hypothetical protein
MSGEKYQAGKLFISESQNVVFLDVTDAHGQTLFEAVLDNTCLANGLNSTDSEKTCRVKLPKPSKKPTSSHQFKIHWLSSKPNPFASLMRSVEELPSVIDEVVARGLRFYMKNAELESHDITLEISDGFQ